MNTLDQALFDTLLACERSVWQALVDGDSGADARALADEFIGVYPSGFADKAGHVGQLEEGPTVATFDLSDVRVLALGPDYGVVSYRARFLRPGNDAWCTMYVSSIWRRHNNGWVNVLSQDTPA